MDYQFHDEREEIVSVTLAKRSTLAAFLTDEPEYACLLGEFDACTVQSMGLRLSCGEASQGSDGYVAVAHSDSDRLIWLAFFQYSNPFRKVWLQEGRVHAISTLNQLWCFDLDQPEKIQIPSTVPKNHPFST